MNHPMRPAHRNIALLLLSLTLAACGGGGASTDGDVDGEEAVAENGESEQPETIIPVEVMTVERGDIFAAYTGSASLEAFDEASVVAKVGGEVRQILVEEGDFVQRGDVLARLDGDRLRLELEQSRANVARLEQEYERSVELNQKGLVAASAFETTKYELDGLKAQFELAKLEYAYTTIRAPISGVVSTRDIKVGNTIERNAPTFTITALDPLVAYLYVPEREFGRIDAGQPVRMRIDALPGKLFEGTVARISPTVDPETGTFKATVEISDAESRLKPGMFGRLAVIYDQQRNTLLLPRDALIETTSGNSVFVVRDGVAERVEVETGYAWEGEVAVLEGLADEDRVVVVGQAALKTGSKVRVIGEETSTLATASENAETVAGT
ncbi:MAG: efflux RND transporter periplasmic adaptor subunit [Pseudomonadota bacterium]